ncbi:hypothetical protein VSR01_25955 [Actinacidiphila sp. DG2A-62]|uniref:hypothetical protein n=1 Tax=Actinacidiphila sp. DG2A-62 TaxID=3108821 RepID=UPI002DB6542E|nr:hypothetical protein [Actinacidiphila sp. DG2A-62]MEC3996765.1 hypothetical protein [Actinacidiphila sp. DG2A-62]
MHDDDEEHPSPWDRELSELDWSPDVDYLGDWKQARELAAELRDTLVSMGVPAQAIQAEAGTGPAGAGTVRMVANLKLVRGMINVLQHLDVDSFPQICDLGGGSREVAAGL